MPTRTPPWSDPLQSTVDRTDKACPRRDYVLLRPLMTYLSQSRPQRRSGASFLPCTEAERPGAGCRSASSSAALRSRTSAGTTERLQRPSGAASSTERPPAIGGLPAYAFSRFASGRHHPSRIVPTTIRAQTKVAKLILSQLLL